MGFKGVGNAIKAIDGLLESANKSIKKDYIATLTRIIKATPVHFKDGGRLRNSWNLSENRPVGVERSGNAAGTGSISSVARMPKNVLGKKLYFTNIMPYANIVEYGGYPNPPEVGTNTAGKGQSPTFQKLSSGGYSRQAPNGMVRVNALWLRNRLRRSNK